MSRNFLQPVLLIITATAAGAGGWSGHPALLPVALAFPTLWSQARTRLAAALVAGGYFLAASSGLPQGVMAFYSADLWPGLLLWLLASASFVAVHAVLWTKRSGVRPLRQLAAIALMSVPLMGLATRMWPPIAITFASFWLWSATNWTDPKLPDGWQGVDLAFWRSLGRDASIQRHLDLIAIVKNLASGGIRNVVLPESALGFWTATTNRLWLRALRGTNITVIAGAATVDANGYDNVLVTLSADGGRITYRERMPVPGSMWQPWRSLFGETGGARAHFFANPIVTIGPSRAASLICYEQLIVWPLLQSMLYDPDLIIAVGNGWWTKGTSIVAVQRASAVAWAKLFAKPLVLSFNT
ncbi:conjugal transfer protein TraB [Sinorhizobium medicae]|uniref:conjugal transfer protein TraB n=1 Tax=Sinorhizobium medicae TaxID=110321 RepID=UPI000C7A1E36|nr:conjugal transfer protein TraB [Sinorhizobium medicae]PLT98922.1 conjugal transfer protein TraB [Sinorhizobium medicae]